ncbi:hypothetical protein A4D02_27910 [Niastella koreensis]|uniref:TRASH domain-containing protein n=1 Tax=Niastella koreensis TaxID=354356 RepID=A0ABX3NYI4_9BACT|nr:hypothetical protein A4D02_27910 [Niastella koreensis]
MRLELAEGRSGHQPFRNGACRGKTVRRQKWCCCPAARQCQQCQGPIKQGRADRKFCSEGCKNEYHNNQKAESRNEIIRIEKALKNNRRILKKVLGTKQEEIVTRETLLTVTY